MIHGGPHGAQGPSLPPQVTVLRRPRLRHPARELSRLDGLWAEVRGPGVRRPERPRGAGRPLRRVRGLPPQPLARPRRLGIEGGSYGGQLSCWLITQTPSSRPPSPPPPSSTTSHYNYMTYYNQYEEMEWGARPHQGNLMDVLWERSALKHVAKAKTPDHARPRGERQRRADRGIRAVLHCARATSGWKRSWCAILARATACTSPSTRPTSIDRSIAWYEKHFAAGLALWPRARSRLAARLQHRVHDGEELVGGEGLVDVHDRARLEALGQGLAPALGGEEDDGDRP